MIRPASSPKPSFIPLNELVGGSGNQTARIEVRRDGRRIAASVSMMKNSDLLRARLGGSLQELTAELARMFGVGLMDGVLVAGVDEDGPLAQAGLTKGDLIAGIQGQPLHDLARATLLVSAEEPGSQITLRVIARRPSGNFTRIQQADVRVRLR